MTDRELLELAAKATGYDALATTYGWDEVGGGILLDANDPPETWNPLTDDGDALRLAVKLGIDVVISVERPARSAACPPKQIGAEYYLEEDHGEDPYAATRRAIVRAAAEIGRSMA